MSTKLSDGRKRRADDRRQWDKDIRDLYLDVAKALREIDQLHLRAFHDDEADMLSPDQFFSETKRDAFAAHNREVQPRFVEISDSFELIVERAEVIDGRFIFQTIKTTSELISAMSRLAHDGFVYRTNVARLKELRGILLEQTQLQTVRRGERRRLFKRKRRSITTASSSLSNQ